MTIKQLSILIENRQGTLSRVLRTLAANGISIIVSTLADTDGFGIYRVICTDADRAYRALHDQGINVTLSNVFAIRLQADTPGTAAHVIDLFTAEGINIKYMYSFLFRGQGVVTLRVDNDDRAHEIVMLHKLDTLSEDVLNVK